MFETVVLALDGSDRSKRAIPAAMELAKQAGGRIVVAHVDERIAAKGDMPSVHPNETELVEEIKRQAEAISADGVETTVELSTVVLGGPAPEIAKIAKAADGGVIVVGSHGRSALTGMVLGSVAHKLVHISECPVLVVPAR